MNVSFLTFGCRLNRAEALDLEARYQAAGHMVLPLSPLPLSPGSVPNFPGAVPDRIIVRACAITAKAQRDCEKAVARLHRQFPTAEICLTGCHPRACPPPPLGTDPIPMGTDPIPMGTDPIPMATSRAYLKIQDGCSGKCAYCIVPQFRGPPRSVPWQQVLHRAQAFLDAGYRELVITGCNLVLYHDAGRGLADLLAALATLPQADPYRIRIGSVEPGLQDDAILDVMATHPNICRFLHLSLQSGTDPVLERMNRPYCLDQVHHFIAHAHRLLGPRLMLGADIISGFPGETVEDFNKTREFLRHPLADMGSVPISFTNVHAFPYSERPGTAAIHFPNPVPLAVRRIRAKTLSDDARERRYDFASQFLGQEVEVCVEQGGSHGHTAEYLTCHLAAPAPRRSLVLVRVQTCTGDTLSGVVV